MSGEQAEGQGDRGKLALGCAAVATDFAGAGDYTENHRGGDGTEDIPGSGGTSEYGCGFSAADGDKFAGWIFIRLEAESGCSDPGRPLRRYLSSVGIPLPGRDILAPGLSGAYGGGCFWVEPRESETDRHLCSAEHGHGGELPWGLAGASFLR